MRTLVVDHPLVAHKLTVLRDKNTPSPVFRQLTEELVTLLAYEATRDVRTEPVTIETPVSTTIGTAFTKPTPLVVPILRAGLGMLEGMTKLVPTAEVGFLGMARDEETLDIITYAERLPEDLTDRQIFVLDPMLATGGTLREAIKFLFKRGASDVTCICLLAAPEGLAKLEEELSDANVTIVLASIDEKLNEKSYIVPGPGRRRRPPVRHRRLATSCRDNSAGPGFRRTPSGLACAPWTGNLNSYLSPCPMWTAPRTSTSTRSASTPTTTSGPSEGIRFVQLTPPGSGCSICIGEGLNDAPPGTAPSLQLVVSDIQAAHKQLKDNGVDVSDVDVQDWGQFVYFADPDGNKWAVQYIPGRPNG